MEPWKIGVILALIVGLGGYQYYKDHIPPPQPISEQDPEGPKKEAAFDKMVGKPAPAWNIEPKLWANTPKPINIEDLKGHVTVLEFWRSGCSHCREAAPFMQKQVFEKFTPYGLKMVTFHSPAKHDDANDPEMKWEDVQTAMHDLGIKYPVAYDTGAALFRGKYNGFSFPSIFILDRNGIVRYADAGHTPEKAAALLKKLNEMLGLKQPSTHALPSVKAGTTTVAPATTAVPNAAVAPSAAAAKMPQQ